MDARETEALMGDVAAVVRALFAPISARLDDIEARFAALPVPKDGEPGKDADLAEVRQLIADAVGAIPPARDGKDADPEAVRAIVREEAAVAVASLPAPEAPELPDVAGLVVAEVERAIAALPSPKDGEPGKDGRDADPDLTRDLVAEAVATAVAALPPGEPGKSVTVEDVEPLITERVAAAVAALPPPAPGKDADPEVIRAMVAEAVAALPPPAPGKDGAPGKLGIVKEWTDRVHYEGEVATRDGSTYQALKDTGHEPPHEDWICIARGGRDGADGRSIRIRGTHSDAETYLELDVVVLNGAAFGAKKDDPGPCPGPGWQLLASQGKQGKPGEPGKRGEPGLRGAPGPAVASVEVDDGGLLTLRNADGTRATCDLYPLLSRLDR